MAAAVEKIKISLEFSVSGAAAVVKKLESSFRGLTNAANQLDTKGIGQVRDRIKSFDATERWENLERAGIQLSEENLKLKGTNPQHTVKKEVTISEIKALNRMRIHLHYLKNNCFLQDGELINNCGILGEKKVFIIQGSDDPICPKKNALKLHSHLKNSEIELVNNTGHDAFSPKLKNALTNALEKVRVELS